MWSARHYWFTVDATNQLSRTTDHAPFIGTLECDDGLGQPFTPNPVPKGNVSAAWIPLVKGTQGRSLRYVIKHIDHVASRGTITEIRVEELKGRLTKAHGGRIWGRIWSGECKP